MEQSGRSVREWKCWHTGSLENSLAGTDLAAAHPTGEHGLAGKFGVRRQTFGDFGRICHSLRAQNDEESIGIGILRCDLHRSSITIRSRVANDVDGVLVTPMLRKN